MTLSTGNQVRLKISDIPLIADDTMYSDGMASGYALPHTNITSGTAYVLTNGVWTATGASFDPTGFVTLSGMVSANSAFRVRYVYSTFSDDEIGHFTAVGGDVNGAALEAVQSLMFDGLKRAAWRGPDGSQYDDTRAMSLLTDIYDRLIAEREKNALSEGGFWSWSVEQENY